MATLRKWALLASLTLLASCSLESPRARVIVLVLDGADPRAVDLLISEGRLPHFTRLRREGAYGRLQTARPLVGPAVSTTLATGQPPGTHGIPGLVAKAGGTVMRRVPALWNMLSDANRTVAVVGWEGTWPAEAVRGSMVSDRLVYDAFLETPPGPATPATVFPATLEPSVRQCLKRPQDLTVQEAGPLLHVAPGGLRRPIDVGDDLSHFRWALATAGANACIGLRLWNNERPSTLMVQIDAFDVGSHLFGHLFRAPAQERDGSAVEWLYGYVDGVIGELMNVMDDGSSLLVVSGYGFELPALPDDRGAATGVRRAGEADHREQGFLYLFGRAVRPRARLRNASSLDIAPTVLALSGVAAARDMPGRVLEEGLRLEVPARRASYEAAASGADRTPTFPRDRGVAGSARDAAIDRVALERWQALGYLTHTAAPGEADEPSARALAESARQAASRGQYADALKLLEEAGRIAPRLPLVHQYRSNVAYLMGDREAAIEALKRGLELEPANALFRQNLMRLQQEAGRAKPAK